MRSSAVSPQRAADAAWILDHRLQSIAWWRSVMHAYPGGVVNRAMAARMLQVSRRRLNELIELGRLTTITPPEWGGVRDTLVPVDELVDLCSPLSAGRPIVRDSRGRVGRREPGSRRLGDRDPNHTGSGGVDEKNLGPSNA